MKLSQTMLGDNPEKSKNPLKKAMRRRNAKTVTFADPTYFPSTEKEYSSEEENEEDLDFITTADDVQNDGEVEPSNDHAVDTVEPLRIREVPKENGKMDAFKTEATTVTQVNDNAKPQEASNRSSADIVGPQGKSPC